MAQMLLRVKLTRFRERTVCDLLGSGGFGHFCLIFSDINLPDLSLSVQTDQTDAYNKSEHKRNTVKLDFFPLLSEPMSGYKPPSKSYTLASQTV